MNTEDVIKSAKVFNNSLTTKSDLISKTATTRICMAVFYDLRRVDARFAGTKNFRTVMLPPHATTLDV